jgi:hypothetical protein
VHPSQSKNISIKSCKRLAANLLRGSGQHEQAAKTSRGWKEIKKLGQAAARFYNDIKSILFFAIV